MGPSFLQNPFGTHETHADHAPVIKGGWNWTKMGIGDGGSHYVYYLRNIMSQNHYKHIVVHLAKNCFLILHHELPTIFHIWWFF